MQFRRCCVLSPTTGDVCRYEFPTRMLGGSYYNFLADFVFKNSAGLVGDNTKQGLKLILF